MERGEAERNECLSVLTEGYSKDLRPNGLLLPRHFI